MALDESSISLHVDPRVLLSVVENVFLPPKLPQYAQEIDVALCQTLIQTAQAFFQGISPIQQSLWTRMIKMMESIYQTAKSPPGKTELKGTFSNLTAGGTPQLLSSQCITVHLRFRCLSNARSRSERCCRRSRAFQSCSIRNI